MYIRRLKTMDVPFPFYTVHKMTKEHALLDSGAMENFLDESAWRELGIGHFKLPRPLTVHNVDGMENRQGKVEYFCWIKIYYQGQMIWMKFFLTDLGRDRFILGYPFLFAFNPEINWKAAKLKGGNIHLEAIGFRRAQWRVEQCQAAAKACVGHLEPGEVIWMRKLTMA
jgi:hypothetical protein